MPQEEHDGIMPEIEFKANGYLEKTYLDREGGKHITLEFSSKDALEIAKLELMGRDLEKHCPILLEVTIRQTDERTEESGRQAPSIQNITGITK